MEHTHQTEVTGNPLPERRLLARWRGRGGAMQYSQPMQSGQPEQPEQGKPLYERRSDQEAISKKIEMHQAKYNEKKRQVDITLNAIVAQLTGNKATELLGWNLEQRQGSAGVEYMQAMQSLEAIKQELGRIEAGAREITRADNYEHQMVKAENVIQHLEDLANQNGAGIKDEERFHQQAEKEWIDKMMDEKGITTQRVPGTNDHTLDLPEGVGILITANGGLVEAKEYNIAPEDVFSTGLAWRVSLSRKRVIIRELGDESRLPRITLSIKGTNYEMTPERVNNQHRDIKFSFVEVPPPPPPPPPEKIPTPEPVKPTPVPVIPPKPTVEKPKPAVEKPKPVVEKPKPIIPPKPTVEKPKPAVEKPKRSPRMSFPRSQRWRSPSLS